MLLPILLALSPVAASAQKEASPSSPTLQQQVQQLSNALRAAQQQMDETRKQMETLKAQLQSVQDQLAAQNAKRPAEDPVAEKQSIQAAQIEVLNQSKVETDSKYPVRVSGLILLNGFVNTQRVDVSAAPTQAIGGQGSTGLSLRQTTLGIDARGPHIGSARSYADVRVDFFGSTDAGVSSYTAGGLLRLRTAHASLEWNHTRIFAALDRPVFAPLTPTSLTAIASPPLAWSGNLWVWNPQVGMEQSFGSSMGNHVQVSAAWIDPSDAPATTLDMTGSTQAQSSRWPGTEAHLALIHGKDEAGARVGVGGYFSPHRTYDGTRYDAWAATIDARLPLPYGFSFSANGYRGAALGGLGGGAYKDFVVGTWSNGTYARALDAVGGWAQLQQRLGQHWQWNTAFGLDEAFANELRQTVSTVGTYSNNARNRTFFANVIWSPSAYLLFSVEYRRLSTAPFSNPSWDSNVTGLAAAYRF